MFFERGICFGWGYGYVFATYGWRLWGVCNTPLHALHAIHRNTETFFEPGICFGWGYGHVFATYGRRLWGVCCCAPTPVTCHTSKYGHVFRTGYTLSIEIRTCFPNQIYVIHRNTETFSEPGTHRPSKYECVFRTGYTSSIQIRTCFPNRIHVIHQNTDVFSESGEGVDEPEDGEEDDGGAYDAVQYADATNVEPSAEA